MKTFKKLSISGLLVCFISILSIVSVSAQIDQITKMGLLSSAQIAATEYEEFSHDFNNSYAKNFFNGIVKGNFNIYSLVIDATANTQISLAIGMDGYAAVTLIGNNGQRYRNSQFGSDTSWLSSGNANAGKQPCFATSHNSSRTIRDSGQYYGYVAKSSDYPD